MDLFVDGWMSENPREDTSLPSQSASAQDCEKGNTSIAQDGKGSPCIRSLS
jgi:hypothetical protein